MAQSWPPVSSTVHESWALFDVAALAGFGLLALLASLQVWAARRDWSATALSRRWMWIRIGVLSVAALQVIQAVDASGSKGWFSHPILLGIDGLIILILGVAAIQYVGLIVDASFSLVKISTNEDDNVDRILLQMLWAILITVFWTIAVVQQTNATLAMGRLIVGYVLSPFTCIPAMIALWRLLRALDFLESAEKPASPTEKPEADDDGILENIKVLKGLLFSSRAILRRRLGSVLALGVVLLVFETRQAIELFEKKSTDLEYPPYADQITSENFERFGSIVVRFIIIAVTLPLMWHPLCGQIRGADTSGTTSASTADGRVSIATGDGGSGALAATEMVAASRRDLGDLRRDPSGVFSMGGEQAAAPGGAPGLKSMVTMTTQTGTVRDLIEKFGWVAFISIVWTVLVWTLDIVSDIYVIVWEFARNGHWWFFSLSIVTILVSGLVQYDRLSAETDSHPILFGLLGFYQLSPMLVFAQTVRKQDLSLLRTSSMLETIFESLPQFAIQAYYVLVVTSDDANHLLGTADASSGLGVVTLLSVVFSLLASASGMATAMRHFADKLYLPEKAQDNKPIRNGLTIVWFFYFLCNLIFRLGAYMFFAVGFVGWVFLLAFLRVFVGAATGYLSNPNLFEHLEEWLQEQRETFEFRKRGLYFTQRQRHMEEKSKMPPLAHRLGFFIDRAERIADQVGLLPAFLLLNMVSALTFGYEMVFLGANDEIVDHELISSHVISSITAVIGLTFTAAYQSQATQDPDSLGSRLVVDSADADSTTGSVHVYLLWTVIVCGLLAQFWFFFVLRGVSKWRQNRLHEIRSQRGVLDRVKSLKAEAAEADLEAEQQSASQQ